MSAPLTTGQKSIISFLGFASASPAYRELSLSLVQNQSLKDCFEIWAFETDRHELEALSFPTKNQVIYFSGITELLATLQKSQSGQPVVLNPLGFTLVKTFTLPTMSFVLPLDKKHLWAPLQVFETSQRWEEFSDLVLSSQIVVHCSHETSITYPFSFSGFQEFSQQLELIQKEQIQEAPDQISQIQSQQFQTWISQAKENQVALTGFAANSSAPLVTVITPSFNQGEFIQRTIQSVLSQSYPNFEYIVIDGGSSDQTLSILKSYGDQLTWFSEKDRGYADAVRKGFDKARGKYLYWIPSDDEFFDSNSLSTLVSNIERTESDVVYGNCIYVDEDSRWMDQYKITSFSLSRLRNWCLIPQPSTIIRAETYRKACGINSDLVSVADYDLWLRIAEAGGKFLRLGTPISKYRLHSKSITTSRNASTYAEIIRLQTKRYGQAFPGWISGGIGEVLHHLKGKPQVARGSELITKPRGKLRVMLRSNLVEAVVLRVPFFQKMLALLLHRIDG